MKRAGAKATPRNPRFQNEPQSLDAKGLAASIELLREFLAEADGICARMEQRKIPSLTVPAGFGSAAYDRAKAALKTWLRGLREALHDRIENPPPPADGANA